MRNTVIPWNAVTTMAAGRLRPSHRTIWGHATIDSTPAIKIAA